MGISARTAKGDRRSAIIAAAQRLAVDCGYSGFTFDDLARAVGCSRRTLFNHVSSKEEAVLGALPHVTDEQVELLRSGGPTGDLLEDLTLVVVEALGGDQATAGDWQRLHDIVQRNPQLHERVQAHVEGLADELVGHLTTREGVTPDRARVALAIVGGIVGRTIQDLIARPSDVDLSTGVHANLATAREIFAARG